MRVIGIDLGDRRIGVAVSDPRRVVASPVQVVDRASSRSGGHKRDHLVIASLIKEFEAESAVVGLPLSLDGSVGPAAQKVLDEIEEMESSLGVPIVTYDERFTTVEAQRALQTMAVGGRSKRKVIDQVAATVILQAWLDAENATSDGAKLK